MASIKKRNHPAKQIKQDNNQSLVLELQEASKWDTACDWKNVLPIY